MEPLSRFLVRNASEFADRAAVIDGSTVLSHRTLLERVAALGEVLRRWKGRVLTALPNGHAVVVAHYAALVAGLQSLIVDACAPADDLVHATSAFSPEIVLTSQDQIGRLVHILDGLASVQQIVLLPSAEAPSLCATRHPVRIVSWADSGSAELIDLAEMDVPALVLCTSGTTGAPKYVSLTQRNVLAAARNINEFMQTAMGAVEVTPLPLHRSFGLGRARCLSLAGGTLVISPPRGDRALALLARHRATGFSSVPAFFRMMIRTFGKRLAKYLAPLEYIEIGSAPMDRADKLFLLEVAPRARICMHYGLTEASRSAFIEFRSERTKLDTVGRPAPHVAVRVVAENGHPCTPGETGEIIVRGDHVCAQYWKNPELTKSRLRDGWFHTNDYGSVDADGYIRLSGRMDDLMNVGGIKVSPEKIEGVVRAIPGVADCAAVAAKDPRGIYGDVPLLYVVREEQARLSTAAVKSYCVAHLVAEEVPHEVIFIDAIPRTDAGKVLRARLRGGVA